MRFINIIFFFCTFLSFSALGQGVEEQLASQYMSNKEYDKAADVYEKLLSKNPGSGYYYDNLLQCYFNLNQYSEAEKLTKKQQRRFSNNYYFKVDEGYVFQVEKLTPTAHAIWDKLLNDVNGDPQQAEFLASAFQKRKETKYAIFTFERARKKANSPALFCYQLARLYADERETLKMTSEYLTVLQANPMMLEDIQGLLQLYLVKNEDYEIVKAAILKKYKEQPENEYISELLVWLYVQRKDFTSAFMQVKALDRRFKEEGQRVFQLANIAVQNDAYDDAALMYQYIIGLGKDKTNYMNARIGILNTQHKKAIRNTVSIDVLKLLENDYLTFLTEFGRYYFTASVIRDLARLEAYYLNDYTKAISLFQELLEMPRLDNQFKANCKLELGDIYILKAEEWDAMLLFGQVDKDFKEDPLGQEAKFRNARLSYYMGEFEWARAQLDVLKTATTQLIANNALELSLLIQDNTIDSNEAPLLLFAKADLYYYQNKTNEALTLLDSLEKEFPRHSLADDILMKRAEISYKNKNYLQSANLLNQLLKEHGSDILGDNALFMLAQLTEEKLNDRAGALKLYEQFLDQYPGSFFIVEVRKRYRILRGDTLN